jgi:alkylation response protein AidB-like acyl-CoA dehydrogenase
MSRFYGDQNPFGDPGWYQGQHSPFYTDSHRALRDHLRRVHDDLFAPNIHDWDEAGEIPPDARKRVYATGLGVLACGHPFPVQYAPPLPDFLRGVKLDLFHTITVFEEISRVGSVGVNWGLGGGLTIGLPPVLAFGSEAMKNRVAPPVLAGEKIICLAVTEPTAGSDVANIKTSAVKSDCGKFYSVNGEKKWITNGIWADFFTVVVRTGGPGMKGLSLLLIERGMPGVETRKMKCSGAWCSGTTFITLTNVKVPVENLIGEEGKGFKYIVHNFNHERIMLAAQTIRSARTCYEEAWKHCNRRRTFGKLLIEHPVIRIKLADMARQIESCQHWLENLAYQMETMHPREADYKLGGTSALLKVQCTKVLELCAREAAQVFGGLSFSRGGIGEKVERLCREVRSLAIPGGSEEIMIDLGIRMTNRISQIGQIFLQTDSTDKKIQRQIALARRVGVNLNVFGDGRPFSDPSWYLSFNSPYYHESHYRFREWFRKSLPNVDATGLLSGHTVPDCLRGSRVDWFHSLILIDESARVKGLDQTLLSAFLRSFLPGGAGTFSLPFDASVRVDISADGSSYVFNGFRAFVPRLAGRILLTAKFGDSDEIGTFAVDQLMNGFTIVPRAVAGSIQFASLRFTRAEAPLTSMLSETTLTSLAYANSVNLRLNWFYSVLLSRFSRLAFEEALVHANENELMNDSSIRYKFGEMARQVEGTFNWLENLTHQLNCMDPAEAQERLFAPLNLVKIQSTKLFDYCLKESSQILGPQSVLVDDRIQKLGENSRIMSLLNGSEDHLSDEAIRRVREAKL